MICTEFISRIGNSDFCLTYIPASNTMFCKVYVTGPGETDKLGAEIVKKKLTQSTISHVTPRSHVFTQFKRKLKSHSLMNRYFEENDTNLEKYMLRVEEALDSLQGQYDDWEDKLEEKQLMEMEEAELESRRAAEEKYHQYLSLLDDLNMTPVEHLMNLSSWFAAKESMNITAGVLAATSTIWGLLPIWIQIIGAAGSGKTKIEESILGMIPEDNVIYGESTLPALYAQAEANPYFFDRKILSLGDQGSEKDFERNKELFDIGKRLYTDKTGATRRKMEKLDKNGPNELVLEEIKGHCSIFFTTVRELTDTQHVSRTTSLNPVDDMNAFDEYSRHMSTLTPANLSRKNILKEAELLKGMITYKGDVYRDMEFDLINPYYETIIKWTNRLPEPKRAREHVNALLQVIVLFNDNSKQKYVLKDGRVIYAVSKNDILLFERLFRLNVGVSVEAMNFYSWMKSKNRKGQVRVAPLDDDEYEEVTHEQTFDHTWKSLFTVKSIRAKINANQRAFDKKKLSEYLTQLIDVGLVVVLAHDKKSGNNDRIMGLDPYGELMTGGVPFDNDDVWGYVEGYASKHVWLDDEGKEWLKDFVYHDMNSNVEVVEKRRVPWEGSA